MNSYISGIKPNHNLLCDYANPLSLYFIKHLSLLLISSSSCFLRWSVYFIFLKELSILFTFSSHWHVCTVPIIMSLVFVICSLSFFCYSALSEICPFYFLFFKEQALVLLILLLFFRISIISALLIDSFLPNSFPFCSRPRLCALLVNFSLLFSYKDVRFRCLYLHTPNSNVSAFFFFSPFPGCSDFIMISFSIPALLSSVFWIVQTYGGFSCFSSEINSKCNNSKCNNSNVQWHCSQVANEPVPLVLVCGESL